MTKPTIQPDGYYHVFVDDSVSETEKKQLPTLHRNGKGRTLQALGAGLVFLTQDPEKPIVKKIRVTPTDKIITQHYLEATQAFSISAECIAAAAAIQFLPQNAAIKIYSDQADVIAALAYLAKKETWSIKRSKLNKDMYSTLIDCAKAHPATIVPVIANGPGWVARDLLGKFYMDTAHNAARAAVGLKANKRPLLKAGPYRPREPSKNTYNSNEQISHIGLE